MGGLVRCDRAALPGGRQRAAPHWSAAHAANPPVAARVFNLADNAVEEAVYDIASLRRFVGIDLGLERVPDETTVLKFRHLLEQHGLGEKLFAEVGRVLQTSGFALKTGTIVKNPTRAFVTLAMANIYLARQPLLAPIRA